MLVRDILYVKGTAVHTISPDAALEQVVQKLVACNCGSLVVCRPDDPQQMLGIVTERDILRACAAGCVPLANHRVAERMTRDVVVAAPSQSVEDTMGLMTHNRIRHMPVIDEGRLVGIISIGDVVKAQHDALCLENHYLKSYMGVGARE
jgi:CBS domain-containing protein